VRNQYDTSNNVKQNLMKNAYILHLQAELWVSDAKAAVDTITMVRDEARQRLDIDTDDPFNR
jgi:hypothetical protein